MEELSKIEMASITIFKRSLSMLGKGDRGRERVDIGTLVRELAW